MSRVIRKIIGLRGLPAFLLIGLTALATAHNVSANDDEMQSPTKLELLVGQNRDGSATDQWLHAVRRYNDAESMQALAMLRKPFTADEAAWFGLIEARLYHWSRHTPKLQEPFQNVVPPTLVGVLLGNFGGSDAFVATDTVIAFDLSRLQEVYGPASTAMNQERIDRFFAHEYTHLLHRAWRKERGLTLNTPLEIALWSCLTEGLGNYRSLSPRWRNADGSLSEHAEDTLVRLGPVFVKRLAALETATDDEVPELLSGLAMGPFEEKWGALPVALWLAAETAQNDEALGGWVERGPWGVIELANRHLPAELAQELPLPQD